MDIEIRSTPADQMWFLKGGGMPLQGRCFEICTIAVLGWREKIQAHYVLGFVTPPGCDTVPHAWIEVQDPEGFYYLDPTLQDGSLLWASRRNEFVYDKRHVLSKGDVLDWFREQYPDRIFSDLGVPEGPIRAPVINIDGKME